MTCVYPSTTPLECSFNQLKIENPLALQVVNKEGKLIVQGNRGIEYISITLQGKLQVSSYEKEVLFHSSNILFRELDKNSPAAVYFKVVPPPSISWEIDPMVEKLQQEIWDTDTFESFSSDESMCTVVADNSESLLPSYCNNKTGSKVDYAVVVTAFTGSESYTTSSSIVIEADSKYPSANLFCGVNPVNFFGVSDVCNDRLCVKSGSITVPIPTPLRIGSASEMRVYGMEERNVTVFLSCYETGRSNNQEYGTSNLIRTDIIFNGIVKDSKISVCLPKFMTPSFMHKHLCISYNLYIKLGTHIIAVPVGVNYSGKECS